MSKICVIGSVNIDIVFGVKSIAKPKETISTTFSTRNLGGKGLNQAIALAKSFSPVFLAANIGANDKYISRKIQKLSLNTDFVRTIDSDTGTAFIQVDPDGQNCIVLDKGANYHFTKDQVDTILSNFYPGDLIVLQNEINLLDYIISRCENRKLSTAFNPSPFDDMIKQLPIGKISYLLLNEIEGASLAQSQDIVHILPRLHRKYPNTTIVLTVGADGALCQYGEKLIKVPGIKVKPIDTTGAGDTFTGFFLAAMQQGLQIEEALDRANIAAALSVTRRGATSSIPSLEEVTLATKNLIGNSI